MNKSRCFIVGGGPSLKRFDWTWLNGEFVIAINRAHEVLPNADIVYFTDNSWWEQNKASVLAHKGKKIKGSVLNSKINHPQVEEYAFTEALGYETRPRGLRHGYNSGYAAINLAIAHLGFKQVYLLGIDMKWGEESNPETSHWHSGYSQSPSSEGVYVSNMLPFFGELLPMLDEFKAEVFNVNPDSKLTVFPKLTFEQVFCDKYKHELFGCPHDRDQTTNT